MDDRGAGVSPGAAGAVAAATRPRPRATARTPPSATARALRMVGLAAVLFLGMASAFFLLVGRNPGAMFKLMIEGSFGSGYALSETLVKTAPVLLCALGTLLPARLGLISVGAEGQLAAGALAGTAFVLVAGDRLGPLTRPAMLAAAAAGGAGLGALAGLLRARLGVNETISTLLLNYIAPLFIDYLVYGPWKDPRSLGWPSTVPFPDAARLPTYFGTRVHVGLFLGVGLVLAAHLALSRTRWGLFLDLLRSSPALARRAGLRFGTAALVVMALGGACAGIAGIAEASVLEGRLQSGVGAGAGYGGFLVAWMARGRLGRLVPLAVLVSGLAASGDNLQLAADLPSATTYVMQGLLFAAALIADGPRPPRDAVRAGARGAA
jgi:simple sugar transport system permease protein